MEAGHDRREPREPRGLAQAGANGILVARHIVENIKSNEFKLLIGLLPSDERSEFLSDLYILDFINVELRDQLLKMPCINN